METDSRLDPKLLYRRLDGLLGAFDPSRPGPVLMRSFLADAFRFLGDDLGLTAGTLYTERRDDFERATEMARRMVTQWGMSDHLGPMVYGENEGEVFLGRSVTKQVNVSEQTMQKVDAVIRRIIDEQYAIARKLIEQNHDKMHEMAKALLEWETIDADQIDDIMNGRPPRPPKDWATPASKGPAATPPVSPGSAPAAA